MHKPNIRHSADEKRRPVAPKSDRPPLFVTEALRAVRYYCFCVTCARRFSQRPAPASASIAPARISTHELFVGLIVALPTVMAVGVKVQW
jgi:hypothetical protein